MNRIVLLTAMAILCGTMLQSQKGKQTRPAPARPSTVDEAVTVIKTKWLSPKDLDWLLRIPKEQAVSRLYRPFGTGLRNAFGLWGDNQPLKDSCGTNDPEGCSVVILNRLWESVRADADPALVRQIDCQFQLVQKIHINYQGFHKLTIGELLKAMQAQIDEQMAKQSGCQTSLTLEVEGKVDRHCYVDARFAVPRKDQKDQKAQPTENTLEKVLDWLSFFNFFRMAHEPPRITLNFARECHFPTPPYLYADGNK